jgi:hypothetical protein
MKISILILIIIVVGLVQHGASTETVSGGKIKRILHDCTSYHVLSRRNTDGICSCSVSALFSVVICFLKTILKHIRNFRNYIFENNMAIKRKPDNIVK